MGKLFMIVVILIGFSANAENAEKWKMSKVLMGTPFSDAPFPTSISLVREDDQQTLFIQLPAENLSYSVVPGACTEVETQHSYKDADGRKVSFQLRELAKTCELNQKITLSLSWKRRSRYDQWRPDGEGVYIFRISPDRNALSFFRINRETNGLVVNSSALYTK